MDWKNSCSHVSSRTVNHADWWKRPCAAGVSEVPVWMCAPQHRWAPWCRCTSAPVVPEGLWSGCASTAGAFCTLNSASKWLWQRLWISSSSLFFFLPPSLHSPKHSNLNTSLFISFQMSSYRLTQQVTKITHSYTHEYTHSIRLNCAQSPELMFRRTMPAEIYAAGGGDAGLKVSPTCYMCCLIFSSQQRAKWHGFKNLGGGGGGWRGSTIFSSYDWPTWHKDFT